MRSCNHEAPCQTKEACRKLSKKAYDQSRKEAYRERRRLLNVKWYSENKARKARSSSEWFSKNKEKWKAYNASLYEANKLRYRNNAKLWGDKNPHKQRVYRARYRAAKLRATPTWADPTKINAIYAGCPKGHEVDHIVPLQGKNVCGLHVDYNLQYLPVSENRRKSNALTSIGGVAWPTLI